jgi:hypothetical protein
MVGNIPLGNRDLHHHGKFMLKINVKILFRVVVVIFRVI